jgi:hypothetical protein
MGCAAIEVDFETVHGITTASSRSVAVSRVVTKGCVNSIEEIMANEPYLAN